MASIKNSLKYESDVELGKVWLITSGEFVRVYNLNAWHSTEDCHLFYPDILQIKRCQTKTFGGLL